jgi:hypothetical protein
MSSVPSILTKMAKFHSFGVAGEIALCIYATVSLFFIFSREIARLLIKKN